MSQKASTMNASHHAHGLYALSPLALLGMLVPLGIAFWWFMNVQIGSTEQAVFGLLQQSVHVDPAMTQEQVSRILNGATFDKNQQIAVAIAWGVQIAILLLAFPPDVALMLMHRNSNIDPSPSMAVVAERYDKARRFLTWFLVGCDILTDFLFVVSGHELIAFHGILPNFSASGWGVIIVGLLYPASICFVTVFVGKYFIAFAHALIAKVRTMKEA